MNLLPWRETQKKQQRRLALCIICLCLSTISYTSITLSQQIPLKPKQMSNTDKKHQLQAIQQKTRKLNKQIKQQQTLLTRLQQYLQQIIHHNQTTMLFNLLLGLPNQQLKWLTLHQQQNNYQLTVASNKSSSIQKLYEHLHDWRFIQKLKLDEVDQSQNIHARFTFTLRSPYEN